MDHFFFQYMPGIVYCQKFNFFCLKECVEPLQELVEGPVAAEDLLPDENAEGTPNL